MFGENGYIGWIEILWTAIGGLGLAFSIIATWDAFKDNKEINNSEMNHGMEIVAAANIKTEFVRMVMQAAVLTVGITAMTFKPSPTPATTLGWTITIALLCLPVLTAYNSANSIRTRHKLMEIHGSSS